MSLLTFNSLRVSKASCAIKGLCTIIGLLIVLSSCKKSVEDPLLLTINPRNLILDVEGGKNIPLTIGGAGPKSLTRFKIEVQDNNTKTVILDSALSWGKNFNLSYNYYIPARSTAYSLILFFTLLDSDGNTAHTSRTLNVSPATESLTSLSGLKMATKNSGNPDAYDLLNNMALISNVDAVALQDMVDVANVSDPAQVSHSWNSNNGAKFLKFDSFDYANATKASIQAAYATGTSQSQVTNIQAGSIVLIQTLRNNTIHYYAIQVVSINDDTVGTNDFYLFNMKY